ncbi:MAG: C39 family peptidase [Bradymonadia bacterium]
MLMKESGYILVGILLVACANDLGVDERLEAEGPNLAAKTSSLEIAVDATCVSPCTVSVSGVTDELTGGVEYVVNGESVGTSLNWWSDYDHTLPSDLTGMLSIEARVLSTAGSVLQRASANTYIAVDGEQPSVIESEGLPTLRLKVDDRCDNPCELAVEVDGSVAKVEYFSDGYSLGESDTPGDYMISYRFSQPGLRTIVAKALDENGIALNVVSKSVQVLDASAGEPTNGVTGQRDEVPFFYQFDNALSPSATCQNTAVAMVLAYLGWTGVPDDLTAAYGRRMAQSPAGLAELFNIYARRMGTPKRLRAVTNGTFAGLKSELDRGHPVIIHGYFTSSGHVAVVLGYDSTGYYVNDPAGVWSERFMGGYTGSRNGKSIRYNARAFEAAVGTSNGYSPLALWYHVLR